MALRRTPRGMVNTGTRIRPLIPKITKRLRRQQYGQGGGAVVAGYVWCIDNDGTNYGYVRGDYGSITPDTTRASGTEIDYVYVSDTDTMHVGFELGAYLPGISTFIIDLPNGMSFPIYWDMVNHEYNGFETGLTVYAQSLQGTCITIEITHLDHTAVMWMAAFNNTLGEMQTQLIGQGTPETDHSMPMLAPDHEGTYVEFGVDEPVWAYGRVTGPIGSRVVHNTDDVGDYLIPQPHLVEQEEATNKFTWSSDATHWSQIGGINITYDQPGYGGANFASLISDQDPTQIGQAYFSNNTGIVIGMVTFVYDIKKVATATANARIEAGLHGGTSEYLYISINLETGVVAGSTATAYVVIDMGDYWKIFLQNDSVVGTNTRLRAVANPAYYTVNTNTTDISAVQDIVLYNVCAFVETTTEEAKSIQPIFTEGAAVTTGPLKPQFDAANHDNNDGAYYTNVNNTGDDVVLMSDGPYNFLRIESGNVILDDGTNQLQLPIPGPNHVLNGKFIESLNHWNTSGTDGGNTVRWSNGRAFMSTTSLQTSFMQTGLLNIGTDYVLDVDIEIVAGDVNFLSDGTDIALVDGHNTVPFTSSMDGVLFRRGATITTQVYIDNVVVREATPTEQAQFFSVGAVYEGDVAGVNQMNLNIDGVWAADTPYDGSLGTGDIVLGETQHAVTRYQGGTYEEKKDKIDERMS